MAVRDVFEHPTLSELARSAESGTVEEYDWESPIVFNDSGDREAVILIDPVNVTTPYWFADLARALGTQHPSFGLQPLHKDRPAGRSATIEEMAEKCIGDLMDIRPEGPYVLGGWSLGGLVAWEVAARLSSEGRAPEALVLIDPPNPHAGSKVRDDGAWDSEILAVLEHAGRSTISGRHEQLLAALFEEHGLPDHYLDLPAGELVRLVEGALISEWAREHYDPPLYGGDVMLFMSAPSSNGDSSHRVEAWGARASGDLVAFATEASHQTILLDQHASALARAISNHLRKSRETIPGLQEVRA